MFFSWLSLLFLASYGFSGAQSNAAENYGARSLTGRDVRNYYGHRREATDTGRDLLQGSLKSAVELLTATVDSLPSGKRSDYSSLNAASVEARLNSKMLEAEDYAKKLEMHNLAMESANKQARSYY